MIFTPTRKRGSDRSNILDLLITKDETKIEDIKIGSPLGSSDHAIINFKIMIEPKFTEREKSIYFYSKCNYGDMCNEMKKIEWKNVINPEQCIDDQWEQFSSIILSARDKYVPFRKVILNNKTQWSVPRTQEMKVLGNKRDRQWTRYMETIGH